MNTSLLTKTNHTKQPESNMREKEVRWMEACLGERSIFE